MCLNLKEPPVWLCRAMSNSVIFVVFCRIQLSAESVYSGLLKMPVTNQWRQKSKVEEPQPPPQPQPAAGKKATEVEEPVGRRGRFSQASKKDEKQTKAAEAAKQQSDDDEEDNAEEEEESNQPGRIRNLAGFFATQKDDPKNVKKKRFEVADSDETIILENEPERLEGVIRADDPGEWEKPIELEKGWAKNMANIFQNRPLEDNFASKKPFKMDLEEGAQTIVLENEPVVLEGVVRSSDKTEDVIGKRGRIKNIAGRFANPQAAGDRDDEGGYRKDPIDVDPSRSRNVADKWKQQQYEESAPSGGGGGKPKWMLELESAQEYGVFENEPEVRSDVVHADDEQPDVISAQHTRNLRKMWSQIEKEEVTEKEPRRRDIVIRPRKKEPSPEPEPPPPPKPVEEPKPARRFGAAAAPGNVRGNVGAFGSVYGKLAKKEKTPPPPEPEPPPKPVAKRGGFRQAQQPVSPPTNPEPETKSPFKTSLKPVPRRK